MTPIYFPFTCISDDRASALLAYFPQIRLIQPVADKFAGRCSEKMTGWAAAGRFDIRTPEDTDSEKIAGIIRQYRQWAEIHQGTAMTFLKSQQGEAPFFDDISAHHIRTEVQRQAAGNAPKAEAADPLFLARIFLAVAQAFDMRESEIASELSAVSGMETELLKNLRGAAEFEDAVTRLSKPSGKFDPGEYMTEKRIEAWARLAFRTASDDIDSGLFVTDSPLIREAVADYTGDSEKSLEAVVTLSAPVTDTSTFQAALTDYLQALTRTPELPALPEELSKSSGADAASALTIYRAAGLSPAEFLNRCAGTESSNLKTAGTSAINTVIAVVQGR